MSTGLAALTTSNGMYRTGQKTIQYLLYRACRWDCGYANQELTQVPNDFFHYSLVKIAQRDTRCAFTWVRTGRHGFRRTCNRAVCEHARGS